MIDVVFCFLVLFIFYLCSGVFMNKKMKLNIYGLGMGWLLLCSGHTMANDVYEAMRGLSLESENINQILTEKVPEFATMMNNQVAQGYTVTLKDTVGKEANRVEVIVRRANENTVQYQRLQGKGLPFFVVVRNHSSERIKFKPNEVRLTFNDREYKPMTNSRLEQVLKRTNLKEFSLKRAVSDIAVIAKTATAIPSLEGVSLMTNTLVGALKGSDVTQVILQETQGQVTKSGQRVGKFKDFHNMIQTQLDEEFKAGDNMFLHMDEMDLPGHSLTSFNIFFEEATLNDKNMQIRMPMASIQHEYKFKFVDEQAANF